MSTVSLCEFEGYGNSDIAFFNNNVSSVPSKNILKYKVSPDTPILISDILLAAYYHTNFESWYPNFVDKVSTLNIAVIIID